MEWCGKQVIRGLCILNLKYGCTSTVSFMLAETESLWHFEFSIKLNTARFLELFCTTNTLWNECEKTQISYHWEQRFSPGTEPPGREADQSHPFSTEVKNSCSYNSTPVHIIIQLSESLMSAWTGMLTLHVSWKFPFELLRRGKLNFPTNMLVCL
jgi:hypothetical protein